VGGSYSTNFEMLNAYTGVVRRTKAICHLKDAGVGDRIVLEETTETWGKLVVCYEIDDKPPAFIQRSVFQGFLSKY